ncbi:ferredoxin [Elusimicrobium simillimum]|uniref:4Fe-4S dicluster domain-containing protein n=1 Tax=Elusimicrobium simillimum TaxID=3143438 RepID=UPI003C6F71D1
MHEDFIIASSPKRFIFRDGEEPLHQHVIFTQMGQKALYDSVSQCNKCAYCSRACPFQLLTNTEDNGPRARNILLRYIMEAKVGFRKNTERIKKVTSGCMLCGLCTKECFAKVPTHEHVLELERSVAARKLPLLYRAQKILISLNPFSLKNKLKKETAETAAAFFLPSFEAKFTEVKTGVKIYETIKNIFGTAGVLYEDTGMYEYVYGTLPQCRSRAQKLMEKYFKLCPTADKKIVTDSLEIYNFIQKYPQIFHGTQHFEKAQKFAANTKFLADVIPLNQIKKTDSEEKVILTKTSLFSAEDELFHSSSQILGKMFKHFTPAWYGQNYPLALFGYDKIKPKETAVFFKIKSEYIAYNQADIVVCTSLAQKNTLNKCLKKYYAKARVFYIGDIGNGYADRKTDS